MVGRLVAAVEVAAIVATDLVAAFRCDGRGIGPVDRWLERRAASR